MNSKKLFEEAKKFMPGGVNSPVRAFEPYPFLLKEVEDVLFMTSMEIHILIIV